MLFNYSFCFLSEMGISAKFRGGGSEKFLNTHGKEKRNGW